MIYTVYDSDKEVEVQGTLDDLEEHFDGYVTILNETTIEVIWDHSGEYVYWQFEILAIDEE